MTRRRFFTVLTLVAAGFWLWSRPLSASASAIANFRLTNTGNTPISQVDFNVIPPGSITPPVVGTDPTTGKPLTGSPMTILPGSTGFDPSNFSVALGSGPGVQGLRLLFGQKQTVGSDGQVTITPVLGSDGQPTGMFQPGGQLNFALSVDPSYQGALQLVLPSTATGLSLTTLSADPGGSTPQDNGVGGTGAAGDPANQVPEPLSITLWSAATLLGLTRARVYRRARRARATLA